MVGAFWVQTEDHVASPEVGLVQILVSKRKLENVHTRGSQQWTGGSSKVACGVMTAFLH